MARKDAEHGEVLELVGRMDRGSLDERGDVWRELVQKEERVLKTVDRVVNTARDEAIRSSSLLHTPMADAYKMLMLELPLMLREALEARDGPALYAALLDKRRKVYCGVLLILAAALMMFAGAAGAD
jgi:hypothetical protein